MPLSLPAHLVEQRPDIRAAEAQPHAASARIGIARAARLPSVALTASLVSAALYAAALFESDTGFWSIGAALVQPCFHGDSLMHQEPAAEAAYDQVGAQCRSTVLTTLENVGHIACDRCRRQVVTCRNGGRARCEP